MDKTYCCDNGCSTIECEHHFNNVKNKLEKNELVWFYVSKPLDCEKWTPKKN